jgi:hypothetical protein
MGRNERLHKMLGLVESEIPSDAEVIVVMDVFKSSMVGDFDLDCLVAMHPKTIFVTTNIRGCWRCTNVGLDAAKYDFVMWTADDAIPRPGWYWAGIECFRQYFPDGMGLLILNDLMMKWQIAGHAMTTKRFLTAMFGEPRFPEGFNHLFCDTMVSDWAFSLGRREFCENSVIEHMHWSYGKSERDETNIICDGWSTGDKDYKDKLDRLWFKQGGREAAMARLGIASLQIPPMPKEEKKIIKSRRDNSHDVTSFQIPTPHYMSRKIAQSNRQSNKQARQKREHK